LLGLIFVDVHFTLSKEIGIPRLRAARSARDDRKLDSDARSQ